jgi:hypothetical protein
MYFPPAESAESTGVSSRVTVLAMVISTSAWLEAEAASNINKDRNAKAVYFVFIESPPCVYITDMRMLVNIG